MVGESVGRAMLYYFLQKPEVLAELGRIGAHVRQLKHRVVEGLHSQADHSDVAMPQSRTR